MIGLDDSCLRKATGAARSRGRHNDLTGYRLVPEGVKTGAGSAASTAPPGSVVTS